MDIILHEPESFKDIFLCMGPFHWTKILLRCQGRLLRGSGIDDGLVECDVFGPGVKDSALNGSHYVRSLICISLLTSGIKSTTKTNLLILYFISFNSLIFLLFFRKK